MTLTGHQRIGSRESAEGADTFRGVNPATGEELSPAFHEASAAEIDAAVELADAAFPVFRDLPAEARADFLEAICEETLAVSDVLLERAAAETGYPLARCAMERDRAVNQARLFADLVREGSWADARIDHGDPARAPMPKPDVRSLLEPVGPVAVFGASNFPIAISVLGADTVSAFACGCPVVVKGHPAHPGTCEIAAEAILRAAARTGMPEGVFSLVQGRSHETGAALVRHPKLAAAAFTGSLAGGRALFDLANSRPVPIPFYAEMGSVNPVFVLPGALEEDSATLATGFVSALTMGVGQFCTNPALVFGCASESWERFSAEVGERVAAFAPATMLHPGIRRSYAEGIEKRLAKTELHLRGASATEARPEANEAAAYVFETDQEGLMRDLTLYDELFGPVSTLVSCGGIDEMVAAAEKLEGSLSATVHGSEEDLAAAAPLVSLLRRKAGRLIFNGFPVGIEVCHSMHHGGPYPATAHSFFTSIGTRCILRFVRPVCYQNWPAPLLPEALRDLNPRGLWRLVDGERTRGGLA